VAAPSVDIFADFQHNIMRAGLSHIVAPLKGDSVSFGKLWTRPIDFIFIDGNHSYEGVRDDLNTWAPFLRSGGVLSAHDVFSPRDEPSAGGGYEAGPGKALDEYLHSTKSQWCIPTLVGTLMLIKKR
jgi:predicted O-methyltransferase YrrM